MVGIMTGSEAIKIIGKRLEDRFTIDSEPHYSVYKQIYMNLTSNLESNGKGIILIGSIGIGKTMLMRIMQKLFRGTKSSFRWINAYELKDMLDDGYSVPDIKNMYGKSLKDNLYIDDIGMNGSDYLKYGNSINIISEILVERYELFLSEGYRTHLSSNLPTSIKDSTSSLPTIEKIYGARIYDRIKEMCELITIQGQSLRR